MVGKNEFAIAALKSECEIFVVYTASLAISNTNKINSSHRAQIALLQVDKAPTTFLPEYFDFTNIFSPKHTAELPEHTEMNDDTIDFIVSK